MRTKKKIVQICLFQNFSISFFIFADVIEFLFSGTKEKERDDTALKYCEYYNICERLMQMLALPSELYTVRTSSLSSLVSSR